MPFSEIALIARIVVPLIIFKWPLLGILLSTLVDMYDWQFATVTNDAELAAYQWWDKLFDVYYQIIIFLIIFRYKDRIFKKTAIVLFVYRMLGVLLFTITHIRQTLLIFPNFFENFVIFYLFYRWVSKKDVLFKNKKILTMVLLVIALPKIFHEYVMHYLMKQPWNYVNVGEILGLSGIFEEYANYFYVGGLFYVIPMGALLLYFMKQNKKSSSKNKLLW